MKMKTAKIILFLTVSTCLLNLSVQAQQNQGAVSVFYYWKAKPGKLEEYNRYIREAAEPIDAEAQKQGAFLSVTTFVTTKADSPWTHLRVFVLKDRAQLDNLSQALEAASSKLEPNEAKRTKRAEYAATLRDLVVREVVDILR
jgi:hypothetical protein